MRQGNLMRMQMDKGEMGTNTELDKLCKVQMERRQRLVD